MLRNRLAATASIAFLACLNWLGAGQASPEEWGAPAVTVSHSDGKWAIAGKKNTVVLDESDLSVAVHAEGVTWRMVPSSDNDLLVNSGNDEFHLRLADARQISITPYRTGFRSGVKITLGGFESTGLRSPGSPLDMRLFLTMGLEAGTEELVFEAMALERETVVRELNWPTAIDGREVDYTVLSNDDGVLLPRDWPKLFHPIHRSKVDTSVIQSNLIETWSMSWWGFEKGNAAMMLIVETPDDAGYTFSHPAGGPTSMGPTWRAQLGRFGYLRSLRMAFLPKGNYVDLAKRYRRYVMDSGQYVPLKDKIARSPVVKNLIGSPFIGLNVLANPKPGTGNYDPKDPKGNYHLITFEENARHLRQLKASGQEHLNVSLSGWTNKGYDWQHPDVLPPNQAGGGWEGMKFFFDTCRELRYTCWLHDQYRDYYVDAPSYSPDFAVHEGDAVRRSIAFPGTRFGKDWKDGYIPLMNFWDGGTQGYLNNRYMLGHLLKNYRLIFEHGIHPQGSFQDVFGYVAPDEDFNPEHPSTRTDSMKGRAAVFNWIRHNLGAVGTEVGSDWVMPFVDYTTNRLTRNPNSGNDETSQGAIDVPLYELVYHDAIITEKPPDDLRGFLHASAPSTWRESDENRVESRRRAELQQRLALVEMVNHEFLNERRSKERTTFADGTRVTVDWDAKTVDIKPELKTLPAK